MAWVVCALGTSVCARECVAWRVSVCGRASVRERACVCMPEGPCVVVVEEGSTPGEAKLFSSVRCSKPVA